MGHAGYASKSAKRKQRKTPHEKERRSRTSRMRLRRKKLGVMLVCIQEDDGRRHVVWQRREELEET